MDPHDHLITQTARSIAASREAMSIIKCSMHTSRELMAKAGKRLAESQVRVDGSARSLRLVQSDGQWSSRATLDSDVAR